MPQGGTRRSTRVRSSIARDLRATETAFASTFKGVDAEGQTLVWSSDTPASGPGFVIRIVPMGSGAKPGRAVTALGTFARFDVTGTVDVLPLTASR